jgi:hypothetical protein
VDSPLPGVCFCYAHARNTNPRTTACLSLNALTHIRVLRVIRGYFFPAHHRP